MHFSIKQHCLSFLFSAFIFIGNVQAQTPSAESLETLLALTETEKTVTNMHQQIDDLIRQSMEQALQGHHVTPEDRITLDEMLVRVTAVYKDELSWEKMKSMSKQIYAESFNQPEIDGLISFYQSPSGRAFVAKMPIVMQKSVQLMQERVGPLLLKMQDSITTTVREIEAEKTKRSAQSDTSATQPNRIGTPRGKLTQTSKKNNYKTKQKTKRILHKPKQKRTR